MFRIFMGGLLAGIVVFIWGALSHMVLGLGEAGIRELPHEEVVLQALRENVTEPGFYFFPWLERAEITEESVKAWEERWARGPSGIMVYMPRNAEAMSVGQLGREFVANTCWCWIAAFLLAWTAPSLREYWKRVLFVALIGLMAGLDVYVSYWNWYNYPLNYTVAIMFDQVIAFTLAGLVLGGMIRAPAAQPVHESR